MLYFFLRLPIRTAFKVYFKKVFIVGEENIPRGKSLIFATNHPTAFLDPILYPSFGSRVFHFILRGDVFTTPFIRVILRGLHCIPIYRFRDGFEAMRKNVASFKQIYQILGEGKRDIAVMAEGMVEHRKKLKPIQKGAATMAFGAWKKTRDENIAIVPTGFYYTDSHQFRSYVTCAFGEPIYLKDYIEGYREDERKAISDLTKDLEEGMRRVIVHIENDADEPYVNKILDIERNNRRDAVFPIRSRDNSLLKREWRIADVVNTMEPEDKEELFELLTDYNSRLKEHGVEDTGLAQPNQFNIFNSILLLLGFVPFLLGFILNYLPFRISYAITDRIVKQIEFHASIRFGFGMVLTPIWWILLWITALICGAGWWSLLVITVPFIGYFALIWIDLFKSWNSARKVAGMPKEKVRELTLMREDLIGRVED